MAKTAFLLGGTGQIGRASASRFLAAGWNVVLASRGDLLDEEGRHRAHRARAGPDARDRRSAVGDPWARELALSGVAFREAGSRRAEARAPDGPRQGALSHDVGRQPRRADPTCRGA